MNDKNKAPRTDDALYIEGKHSVIEALRAHTPIERLLIEKSTSDDNKYSQIIKEAKKNDIAYDFVPKSRLDKISERGHHQGVMAKLSALSYHELDEVLDMISKKGDDAFIIILDGIEDPHNLGAIIRTANLAGAHAVVIRQRRSAGLTSTVMSSSAGAANYTPVVRVTNLSDTIDKLKDNGLWIACADMSADVMYDTNLTGPIAIVIGAEGAGISRLVREKCDFAVSIPMMGDIDSLNASVAAGVVAYEVVRQRRNLS